MNNLHCTTNLHYTSIAGYLVYSNLDNWEKQASTLSYTTPFSSLKIYSNILLGSGCRSNRTDRGDKAGELNGRGMEKIWFRTFSPISNWLYTRSISTTLWANGAICWSIPGHSVTRCHHHYLRRSLRLLHITQETTETANKPPDETTLSGILKSNDRLYCSGL
jgi:hypothetical protein